MPTLDERYYDALRTLSTSLEESGPTWALTGSTSFALQGVPVTPNDIDVQTTEDGAYAIEDAFTDRTIDPVSFSESERIRSHFGALEVNGIRVEIMGGIRKRRPDGTWEPPVDIAAHREFADFDGLSLPVLSLEYEATAYERLGRTERAALLSDYADP